MVCPIPRAILVVAAGMFASCATPQNEFDLAAWNEIRIPKDDLQPRVITGATRSWDVYLNNGRAYARPKQSISEGSDDPPFAIEQGRAEEGLAGDRVAIEVDDGWLIGFDAGEFGGGLWWFSLDGLERHRILLENVCGFFTAHNAVYVLTGLDHLGLTYGAVSRVSRNDQGVWVSELVADINERPIIAAGGKGLSLVVVTSTRLLQIDADGGARTLLGPSACPYTFFNSIVVDDRGVIYVAANAPIVKVIPRANRTKVTWLRPPQTHLQHVESMP